MNCFEEMFQKWPFNAKAHLSQFKTFEILQLNVKILLFCSSNPTYARKKTNVMWNQWKVQDRVLKNIDFFFSFYMSLFINRLTHFSHGGVSCAKSVHQRRHIDISKAHPEALFLVKLVFCLAHIDVCIHTWMETILYRKTLSTNIFSKVPSRLHEEDSQNFWGPKWNRGKPIYRCSNVSLDLDFKHARKLRIWWEEWFIIKINLKHIVENAGVFCIFNSSKSCSTQGLFYFER